MDNKLLLNEKSDKKVISKTFMRWNKNILTHNQQLEVYIVSKKGCLYANILQINTSIKVTLTRTALLQCQKSKYCRMILKTFLRA